MRVSKTFEMNGVWWTLIFYSFSDCKMLPLNTVEPRMYIRLRSNDLMIEFYVSRLNSALYGRSYSDKVYFRQFVRMSIADIKSEIMLFLMTKQC